MDYDMLQKDITKNVRAIDEYIKSSIKFENKDLREASLHLFQAGGKRIRPYLMATVYSIFQEDLKPIIPIAAAVEILHTFTLIHDDIMDKDKFRRNIPTVHTKWDENLAILAGDALQSTVFHLISQSPLNPEKKCEIISDFSQTLIRICEGQVLDLQFEKKDTVSTDEYLDMVSRKTGDLIALSVRTGGYAAGADSEICESLSQFGMNYGVAFQIIDDILGIIGDEKFGKPIGSDIRQGKKSYVILSALSLLNSDEQENLRKLITGKNLSEQDIQKAIKLIQSSGAVEDAHQLAKGYIKSALDYLAKLPSHDGKERLKQLTQLSLGRKF